MIFFVLASVFCTTYIALFSLVYFGMQRNKKDISTLTKPLHLSFSILIPFRNEAHRIQNILESINQLSYPKTHFEVIFIDDHSSDETQKAIQQQVSTFIDVKIIRLPKHLEGKKQALQLGVKESKYDYIITTDADCWVPITWLESYRDAFLTSKADLCLGAVSMRSGETFLEKFQYYDYIAMQAFNFGLSHFSSPILCSGANLAYAKTSFLSSKAYQENKHIASGDDTFLLEAFLREKMKVMLVYEAKNLVYTEPATSIQALIQQRKRWLSKLPKSNNSLAKKIAWMLALGNFSWLFIVIYSLVNNEYYNLCIIVSVLKFGSEFFVTLSLIKHLQMNRCNRLQLIQQFIYPFAFILFMVAVITQKNTFWKERKITN